MQIFRQAMAVSKTHIKTIEEWVEPRWRDESDLFELATHQETTNDHNHRSSEDIINIWIAS